VRGSRRSCGGSRAGGGAGAGERRTPAGPGSREAGDEDQRGAAAGAPARAAPRRFCGGSRGGGLGFRGPRFAPVGFSAREDRADFRQEAPAVSRGEEPVVADLHEALREDVLEEESEEGFGGNGPASRLPGGGVPPPVGDGAVPQRLDPPVGDGRPEDVGGEVLDGGLSGPDGEAVGDPPLGVLPDGGGNEAEEAEAPQLSPHPEFDGGGEGLLRKEVPPVSCGDPPRAVGRESAGGDDVVDVGVVSEVPAPGVEDAEESGQAAEVSLAGAEVEDGACGGAEEGAVEGALVGAGGGPALRGQGDGDEEVRDGKEEGAAVPDPRGGLPVPALRAGAVAAGVVAVLDDVGALGAGVEASAEGGVDSPVILAGNPV